MVLPTAMMHLRDNPETVRNPRLVELLKEEGWETEGVFEDEYGDVHDWNNGVSVQHFLCRCLYLHYTQHVRALGFPYYFPSLPILCLVSLPVSLPVLCDCRNRKHCLQNGRLV